MEALLIVVGVALFAVGFGIVGVEVYTWWKKRGARAAKTAADILEWRKK